RMTLCLFSDTADATARTRCDLFISLVHRFTDKFFICQQRSADHDAIDLSAFHHFAHQLRVQDLSDRDDRYAGHFFDGPGFLQVSKLTFAMAWDDLVTALILRASADLKA